jgi:hypothetical protein
MKKYKFTARIEPAGGGGAYVLFPYDTEKEFGTKARVPVKVSFNGVAYTGSLVKYGHPQHMLPILKNIREKIGKGPGEMVDVVLERDGAVRTVEVPPPFAALLKKEKLLAGFEKLSFTHRKEYCRWVGEARREETRQARMTKAIDMLRSGVKTPG